MHFLFEEIIKLDLESYTDKIPNKLLLPDKFNAALEFVVKHSVMFPEMQATRGIEHGYTGIHKI
ncbi:hypothetical protein AAOGI_33870 [Agarivorans albus]